MSVTTANNLNGTELILDADADTSITADTDDTIDIKTGGTDRMVVSNDGVKIGTTSIASTATAGGLHIETGNSGATAAAGMSDLIIEGSITGNTGQGMSILYPDNGLAHIATGTPTGGGSDFLLRTGGPTHATLADLVLFTHNGGADMTFNSVNNVLVHNDLTVTDDLTVSTGNLVIGTSGKGIDFSATADATTMSSELLDDYEEGTFTATMTGSVSNPTSAVTTTGSYTKIGNVVMTEIEFSNVATTGASGGIRITGLPVTAANPATQQSGSPMFHKIGDISANSANISGFINTTTLYFYQVITGTGADWVEVTHAQGTGRYLRVNTIYHI